MPPKTPDGSDATGLRVQNGAVMGGVEMTNRVHLIYAACPTCSGDLVTHVTGEDDNNGWRWVSWYCPACRKYVDAHFATFPALDGLRRKLTSPGG